MTEFTFAGETRCPSRFLSGSEAIQCIGWNGHGNLTVREGAIWSGSVVHANFAAAQLWTDEGAMSEETA